MNSFWRSFSDQFQHCGRNPTLFLMALPAVLALVSLGVVFYSTRLREYLLPVASGLVLLCLAGLLVARRRARARRRATPAFPPLSRDELRVARSKLMNERD